MFVHVCIKSKINAAISPLDFYTYNSLLSEASTSFHWECQTFLLQQGLLQKKYFQ